MEMASAALHKDDETFSVYTQSAEHSNVKESEERAVETVAVVTDIVINEQREDDDKPNLSGQVPVLSPDPVNASNDDIRVPDQQVTSPTETLSTTDSSSRDIEHESSIETLTVVSADTSSVTSPMEELLPPCGMEVKTRERGDLVVVGSGSERTTPSSDSAASHNRGEIISFHFVIY